MTDIDKIRADQPTPTVRALCDEVEKLREENAKLRALDALSRDLLPFAPPQETE